MTTRRIAAKDKAAWLALFKGYNDFYEATVPAEVVEDLWRRLLRAGPGDHIGFVAVDAGDTPVGLAHILFHASSWAIAPDCYLEDLYVDPAARKSGIGRALIAAVYAEADARGARRTYWMTQDTNATARRLYDQVAKKSEFVQYRR
jgi:GNAT superfamily N-acetyltransferase